MFTRKELHESPDYWMEIVQNDLFRMLEAYREAKGLNRAQLAEDLGYTKGYVSQLLNGGFNHSIRKLIELSLKVGKVPKVVFEDMDGPMAEGENRKRRA